MGLWLPETFTGFRQVLAVSVMWVVFLAMLGSLTESKCDFKAIFNFGDSNSDTGGFWAAFPAQSGPYGMTYFKRPSGRASDGRLIIDFLAQALGLPFLSPYLQSIGSNFKHGANFATLASTVLLPNASLFVTGISPFSLAIQLNQMKEFKAKVDELHFTGNQTAPRFHISQVKNSAGLDGFQSSNLLNSQKRPVMAGFIESLPMAFLTEQLTKPWHLKPCSILGILPSPGIFGKSLYTFYIGQNDFTSNLAAIGIAGVKQYLPQVISQIAGTIKELHGLGGRTFLVLNLAPVGCYPAFLVELPHNSSDLDMYGCLISYNNAVLDYNNMLKDTLRQTREALPDASVIYMDIHSVMLELFRHPKNHGLLYGTKACCGYGGGVYNFDPQVYCGNSKQIKGSTVTATACADPYNYVSWDGIHATEAANKHVTWAILNGSYFEPSFPIHQLCDLHPIG